MKTIASILRSAFILAAALSTLTLSSCVSQGLLQERANAENFLQTHSGVTYDPYSGVPQYDPMMYTAQAQLTDVERRIEEEKAPWLELAGMLVQSAPMQQVLQNACTRSAPMAPCGN